MPTLVCVPIMVERIDTALADAIEARDAGADLVEFRIDPFFHGSEGDEHDSLVIRQLQGLIADAPLPVILTCRSAAEGGDYDGDETDRVSLLEKLCVNVEHPPASLDFELASYQKSATSRQTINQVLAELDGLGSDNEDLLVLAATNAPWHMDSAFRRPGRFDRVIFVPPPDLPARAEILRLKLAGKPQDDVDVHAIAKKTDRYSGADLAALVDRAIEDRLDEAMATGRPVPLRTKDLLAAAKKQRATTKEWFASAKNYVLYANDGGLYDDLKGYLKL